jgi:hypothetical protein
VDNRTRFLKTMRFEAVDHPPVVNSGPWGQTLARWRQEGLPVGVGLDEYFGLEPLPMRPIGIETLLNPSFEEKVLEETGDYVVKINARGIKERNFRHGMSMPEFLDYPIHGPADLEWLRRKLDPADRGRGDPGQGRPRILQRRHVLRVPERAHGHGRIPARVLRPSRVRPRGQRSVVCVL